ncbi:MAG: DUF2267 domain-containing protein [Opitutaceae bacterium]
MNYDHFINQVHARAHLGSTEKAVTAIRATLQTLAERILPTEAADIAAQLPREIAYYLIEPQTAPERFSVGEFLKRVALRENCDLDDATFHARCVIEVLEEAISPGELRDLLAELPEDFDPLFTAGSRGKIRFTD